MRGIKHMLKVKANGIWRTRKVLDLGKVILGCCACCGKFGGHMMRLPGGRLCRSCEGRIIKQRAHEHEPELIGQIYRLISPGILDEWLARTVE